jgi:hypothetical protein
MSLARYRKIVKGGIPPKPKPSPTPDQDNGSKK